MADTVSPLPLWDSTGVGHNCLNSPGDNEPASMRVLVLGEAVLVQMARILSSVRDGMDHDLMFKGRRLNTRTKSRPRYRERTPTYFSRCGCR